MKSKPLLEKSGGGYLYGERHMEPKRICWNCSGCGEEIDIPANMGNQIFKCPKCKKFFKYSFRSVEIERIEPPERRTASGCRIY